MDTGNPSSDIDPRILLEIIGTQTEIAMQGTDLGGVMALVAQRAQALTGAFGAAIELAEGDDMVYRAVSGVNSNLLGLRLNRHASLSGLCVKEGSTLYCKDSETDDRVDRQACRNVGLRSMLVVPLRHLDTVVGAMKVLSPQVDGFGEADARVLGLMADMVAAAMFNAARHESSELYFRATHDALTGLPNRSLFFDRLRQTLAHAQRQGERIGILNLDMDGLKPTNDHFGHQAGDAALTELAMRIAEACRRTDTVARLGGDEFSVILSPVEDRQGAVTMRDRVAEAIVAPMAYRGQELAIGASIGLSLYPDDTTDMLRLLEIADEGMYEAKRARKAARGTKPR